MKKLVNIKNNDPITIVNEIYNNLAPEKIYLPTTSNLKINDYVYKNTYFDNYISSISGVVTGIKTIKSKKKSIEFYEITNDFKENVLIKNRKVKIKNKEELLNLLTKYKLNDIINKINTYKDINNIVISSIDEDYYSVKEFIRLTQNYTEIIDTLDLLMKVFKINNSLIVTKNTNFSSIKNVKSIIGTYPNIKIILVPDKHLINHSEFLCEFLNIKEDNTLILTTNEIYNLYNILNGKHISEHLITISGNAIEKSLVINAKLGVSLSELIKEYINIIEPNYEIYINGYLNGFKVKSINDIIITKDINYIVINKFVNNEVGECINCGACYKICPYKINVRYCYLKKLNHKKCIGCGLCNFICPANINLLEIVKSDVNEKSTSN